MVSLFDRMRDKDPDLADKAAKSAATVQPEEKRVQGKIIKVDKDEEKGGWGFISSKEIPFTRVFFHWTSLLQDTLKFQDLRNGMKVSFVGVEVEGKGWRAIKIKVIENGTESAGVS